MWYEQPAEVIEDLKALARELYLPQARRLGWEFGATPNHAEALLRSVCTARACAHPASGRAHHG